MTNKQYRACKIINKHHIMNKILEKLNLADYLELYNLLGAENLNVDTSNGDSDDRICVSLKDKLQAEMEIRRSSNTEIWVNRLLAISAIIISLIALLAQLGILRLPRC